MLNLKNVTLIAADCVDIGKLTKAADICESFANFGAVKLLTCPSNGTPALDSRIINIRDINSKEEYDKFMMEEINEYVTTEYALVFQSDGFILNPNAWDEEYLKYDYIGAPWGYPGNKGVGNGGFSLRSKKLLEECANATFEREYGGLENQEDMQICVKHRKYFESKGIKYAPKELAAKFSIEGNPENDRIWTHQFGFHDLEQTDTSNFIIPNKEVKFNVFYKYSDKGKSSQVDKKTIFKNFIRLFGSQNLRVLLDNSTKESLEFFKGYCPEKIIETKLGNSAACIHIFDQIKNLEDHEIVYICEDDYLHASQHCKALIIEGLHISDYVTLYDHGDKYNPPHNQKDPTINPQVSEGGEMSRVLLTGNSHWKTTNSTTMTFAAKVKTIKEDYKILRKYCEENKLPNDIPNDYEMWQELIKSGRKLVSSLPGRSTHLCPNQNYSPLIRWDMVAEA